MTDNRNRIDVRPAVPSDWPHIERLLRDNALPTAGARDHLEHYLVAVTYTEMIGCAGAEVYPDIALLRSVAVVPHCQRAGLGNRLIQQLIERCSQQNMTHVYLLTTTAPDYFARYGFTPVPTSSAPPALHASAEFNGACPADAIFMSLTL